MALKVIQITKINTGNFVFDNTETLTIPVAPLVSAKFLPATGTPETLKIRATLYINSDETSKPSIEEPTLDGTTLTVYFDSNFTTETPETSDVWYVEIDYSSDNYNIETIKEVVSYLRNTNSSNTLLEDGPNTSRGTETGLVGN